MAELTFNLSDLFEQAFGYKTQAFFPEFVPNASANLRTVHGAQGSPYYAKDVLGIEYFMPVTLMYSDSTGQSKQESDLTSGASVGFLKSWQLPNPIISITSKKTVIDTPLTERRGTVKELINIQDYEITVRGFIIGIANEFPEHDVTTLRNIYEQNTALSIQCPLTDIFLLRPNRSGSDQVVITDLKLPAIAGIKNVRPYEIRMMSDEPFNLISIQ
jgi:hypothetical protein